MPFLSELRAKASKPHEKQAQDYLTQQPWGRISSFPKMSVRSPRRGVHSPTFRKETHRQLPGKVRGPDAHSSLYHVGLEVMRGSERTCSAFS